MNHDARTGLDHRGPVNPEALRINFSWLVRLRWGAIAGELVVMTAVDRFLGVALPWTELLILIFVQTALNLGCIGWLRGAREVRETHLAAAVGLDLVMFSVLLHQTGGPSNPFSFLYLVHIAIAALVLSPRYTWALVGLALGCSAALFISHVPLSGVGEHHQHHAGHDFDWHLRGMWVALGIAASLIVYFLHRVMAELREREQELSSVRERTERHERLASLATLAAGAAHELASPLASIAVASKELERALAGGPSQDGKLADVMLIQSQVDRCRRILDQLALDAGQTVGEAAVEFEPRQLIDLALADVRGADRVSIEVAPGENAKVTGPARALSQALRSLVENALDASNEHDPVAIRARTLQDHFRLEVEDRGTGMSVEVRERAVEPFFSTKPTGKGMGLGLFLARSVAEQVGGRLELDSEQGRGTRATLILPLHSDATIYRIVDHQPSRPAFS